MCCSASTAAVQWSGSLGCPAAGVLQILEYHWIKWHQKSIQPLLNELLVPKLPVAFNWHQRPCSSTARGGGGACELLALPWCEPLLQLSGCLLGCLLPCTPLTANDGRHSACCWSPVSCTGTSLGKLLALKGCSQSVHPQPTQHGLPAATMLQLVLVLLLLLLLRRCAAAAAQCCMAATGLCGYL